MLTYVDSSALAKLVEVEPETAALRAWIETTDPRLVSSELSTVELIRAVSRKAEALVPVARAVLDRVLLLSLGPDTLDRAGALEPRLLRTLDAIHVASVLLLEDDLESIVTYDARMAEAAQANGLRVIAPA